jgi:hypothetical protein
MSKNDNWTLGLIDSAWFGSDYERKNGREEAKRIGFESLDLFVGFDPGRMSKTNRERPERRPAGNLMVQSAFQKNGWRKRRISKNIDGFRRNG